MSSALQKLSSPSPGRPFPGDVEVLLSNARLLQVASEPRLKREMLKGKNLALLCESSESDAATLFVRAATELGAVVSHIRPSLSDLTKPTVRRETSRMLGKLYDGIECQGPPEQVVQQIGREAGIPVYAGLAGQDHPTASLAHLLDGDCPDERKRQLLLQAVLLVTLR